MSFIRNGCLHSSLPLSLSHFARNLILTWEKILSGLLCIVHCKVTSFRYNNFWLPCSPISPDIQNGPWKRWEEHTSNWKSHRVDSRDIYGLRNTLFWTTFVKYTDDIWPTAMARHYSDSHFPIRGINIHKTQD